MSGNIINGNMGWTVGYRTWSMRPDGKYYISDIRNHNIDFKHYGINNKSIQNGFMLQEFLQEYMKLILKK